MGRRGCNATQHDRVMPATALHSIARHFYPAQLTCRRRRVRLKKTKRCALLQQRRPLRARADQGGTSCHGTNWMPRKLPRESRLHPSPVPLKGNGDFLLTHSLSTHRHPPLPPTSLPLSYSPSFSTPSSSTCLKRAATATRLNPGKSVGAFARSPASRATSVLRRITQQC